MIILGSWVLSPEAVFNPSIYNRAYTNLANSPDVSKWGGVGCRHAPLRFPYRPTESNPASLTRAIGVPYAVIASEALSYRAYMGQGKLKMTKAEFQTVDSKNECPNSQFLFGKLLPMDLL